MVRVLDSNDDKENKAINVNKKIRRKKHGMYESVETRSR